MSHRRPPDLPESQDAFHRRLQEAARSLAPEPLPDGVLDERLAEPDTTRTWRVAALASAGALVLVISVFAFRALPVATASPTPTASTDASPSGNSSASASASPQPSASPPAVAVTADLILGGSGLDPNPRSYCNNGPDGYELVVPDGWYTNRASDGIRACQFFDDQPFNLGEIVHSVIRLRVEDSSLDDIVLDWESGGVIDEESIDLGQGRHALRRTYPPESSPRVAYFVPLGGTMPPSDARARYLVATLDDSERYETAAPILAEIMDSLSVSDPWRPKPAMADTVDALFADAVTCRPSDGAYTISYPASWSTGSGANECRTFGRSSAQLGQIAVDLSEGAFGMTSPVAGIEDLVVSGYPAYRLEWISDLHKPDPGVHDYRYVVYLGGGHSVGPNLSLSTGNRFGGDYELNVAVLDRMVATLHLRAEAGALAVIPDPHPDLNGLEHIATWNGLAIATTVRCIGYGTCEQVLWYSTDGLRWQSDGVLPGSGLSGLSALAGTDRGWVALSGGNAWFSADGHTWRRTDGRPFVHGLEDGGPKIHVSEDTCCYVDPRAIVATDRGFVAVGAVTCYKCDERAAVWLSQDGKEWNRIPYQASFDAGPMNAISVLPDGRLLAVGGASWVSDDGGRTWEAHALSNGEATAHALVSLGDEMIAIGMPREPIRGVVWTSTDGINWTLSRPDAMSGLTISAATAWHGSLVVAGADYSQASGDTPVVVLQRVGSAWQRITVEPDDHGVVTALAALGDRLIAVGSRPEPPGVWTLR